MRTTDPLALTVRGLISQIETDDDSLCLFYWSYAAMGLNSYCDEELGYAIQDLVDEALNDQGALEINIGDLSDDTEITAVESFTSSPIILVKTSHRIIDEKLAQAPG